MPPVMRSKTLTIWLPPTARCDSDEKATPPCVAGQSRTMSGSQTKGNPSSTSVSVSLDAPTR